MRRQGQYPDSSSNAYVGAPMQNISAQNMSDHFQGRLEAFTPERDQPYLASKVEGQWRWERDEPKVSNSMVSQMFNEGQEIDASRSYYQGRTLEPKLAVEKQGNGDPRSRSRGENMQVSFEEKPFGQSFEGVEQKFLDDIIKLAKEQNDAEDTENARHRERLNAINDQYQGKLVSLRARHASQRDELLRKESQARQSQYQQAMIEQYPASATGPRNPHGYSGGAGSGAINEPHRPYNSNNFDSYGERVRPFGNSRDPGFEPRGPYPGGRVYDAGERYY